MAETNYTDIGNGITVDATKRTARKEHRCTTCAFNARKAKREGRAVNELLIEKGQPYIECYALGEPFNPARYHLLCFTEDVLNA